MRTHCEQSGVFLSHYNFTVSGCVAGKLAASTGQEGVVAMREPKAKLAARTLMRRVRHRWQPWDAFPQYTMVIVAWFAPWAPAEVPGTCAVPILGFGSQRSAGLYLCPVWRDKA